MTSRMISFKCPTVLAEELAKVSHLESLRRGRLVTLSELLRQLATDYLRRETRGPQPATAGAK